MNKKNKTKTKQKQNKKKKKKKNVSRLRFLTFLLSTPPPHCSLPLTFSSTNSLIKTRAKRFCIPSDNPSQPATISSYFFKRAAVCAVDFGLSFSALLPLLLDFPSGVKGVHENGENKTKRKENKKNLKKTQL